MRRKKRLPTRRGRAAGCALAALALLLVVQNLLHTGLLLPIQAIRLREGQDGIRGTRVVLRQWEPDLYRTSLFYLKANERALVLSSCHLTARGWQPMYSALLDCTVDGPLHAGEQAVILDAGEEAENRYYGTHLFVYGRVDDPAIESLEIQLRVPPEEAGGEDAGGGYLSLAAPILQRDGQRYFLLDHRLSSPGNLAREDRIVGRDAAGNTVAVLQIESTGVSSCRRAPREGEP